jgi:hypothetical protein
MANSNEKNGASHAVLLSFRRAFCFSFLLNSGPSGKAGLNLPTQHRYCRFRFTEIHCRRIRIAELRREAADQSPANGLLFASSSLLRRRRHLAAGFGCGGLEVRTGARLLRRNPRQDAHRDGRRPVGRRFHGAEHFVDQRNQVAVIGNSGCRWAVLRGRPGVAPDDPRGRTESA